MTDIMPMNLVLSKLSFPSGYKFIVFSQVFLNALYDIPVNFEAWYKDVKVLGSSLCPFDPYGTKYSYPWQLERYDNGNTW